MTSLTPHLVLHDQFIPRFFYGTAWKETQTADLTFQALQCGFTAIDTANQRKHYFEEGVGNGIHKFLQLNSRKRDTLFIQTKFTFARGQDHRKPYDESDSFTKQVADSFASSLIHLQTEYLDSYVLHGPSHNNGLTDADFEVWNAMEKLVTDQKVKFLGISNVTAPQLSELCAHVKIKPNFVQNRCFARFGWDRQTREICERESLVYQGFSLLTANQRELASPLILALARKYNKTIPQVVFRFSQQLGMICLTGTTQTEHMRQDLNIYDFELNPDEISQIENIG